MIALFLARYGLKKKICGLYCSRQALIYVPKVTSAKSLGLYIRRIIKFLAVSTKAHQSKKEKDTRIKKGKKTKQKNRNYGRLKYFFGCNDLSRNFFGVFKTI